MALGPEDERRLAELAEQTRAADPHFALGLGAGDPTRRPSTADPGGPGCASCWP
ncbi:hypothetical protein ACFQZ4_44855 [Catellatospora coxensis]